MCPSLFSPKEQIFQDVHIVHSCDIWQSDQITLDLTIPLPKDSPKTKTHLKNNTHAAFGGPGQSSEDMEPEVRPKRVLIFRGIISICNICKLLIYLA